MVAVPDGIVSASSQSDLRKDFGGEILMAALAAGRKSFWLNSP